MLTALDRLARDNIRFLIFKSKKLAPPDGIQNNNLIAESGVELVMTSLYASFTQQSSEPWTRLNQQN